MRYSERELYDDVVCELYEIQKNTTDSCINSATDRRGYMLEQVYYIQ